MGRPEPNPASPGSCITKAGSVFAALTLCPRLLRGLCLRKAQPAFRLISLGQSCSLVFLLCFFGPENSMGLMNLWLDRCFHCSLLCSALPSPGFGYLLLVVWRWEVGDTSHPYPPGKGLPQHRGSVPMVALASGCGQVGRQGLPRPSALCPAVCRHLSRRFAPASRLLSQGSLSPPRACCIPCGVWAAV